MTGMSVRLPFAPVVVWARASDDLELSLRLGIARRTILRYKKTGLTVGKAEAFAHALGVHPHVLWGDEYREAITGDDEAEEA